MASDNGIVLMLHMFGYFVSSSCCCFFSVRSSTSSSQSIPKWLRCSLMLHLYWFWSFGQAQAQPQVSIFVAQTKWMCSIHCFSPYTFCVSVCFFFSSSHFEWNEQNERKKKSNVRTAYWLLHILLFLCSSRMLFVGWSIGRSAYPIYYFLFIHIHTDMLFITMWTEHDCLGVLCICTLPQVNKFHIYINRKKHLKNRSKFIHFISNSFLYIARSFVPIDSNRHFQSSIYRYWFDAIAFGSRSVCVCAVFYSPFGCLFVSIFFFMSVLLSICLLWVNRIYRCIWYLFVAGTKKKL